MSETRIDIIHRFWFGELDDEARVAERHQAVVERFGRFAHRNALLGRESTPEETAFLERPGSRF